jgi:sec-independent protein translocase protein TatB
MPGFGDYFFIVVLALILFGPKKLPELARQLGKLMGEFRRASNEFKMQMEEEMRASERAESDRKLAQQQQASAAVAAGTTTEQPAIATAGEVSLQPPATGLPVEQAEYTPQIEPTLAPELEPSLAESEKQIRTQENAAADAVNALVGSIPAESPAPTTTQDAVRHG